MFHRSTKLRSACAREPFSVQRDRCGGPNEPPVTPPWAAGRRAYRFTLPPQKELLGRTRASSQEHKDLHLLKGPDSARGQKVEHTCVRNVFAS